MPKKDITKAERRHRDSLRREGLRVASVYDVRLEKLRRKELRRVLAIAKDYMPEAVEDVIQENIDESGYLPGWWTGLWQNIGLPYAQDTAKRLLASKATPVEDVWLYTLKQYATTRAGNEIVIVSGTWKKALVKIVRRELADDPGIGIEKLTKKIYDDYLWQLEKWQCRRIAQTEAMIGMAQAGDLAAQTLDVPFTKQWVISGLGNTRPTHEMMDGIVVDMDEPFELPGGLMMYPHDTNMGASADEIINCACDCIRRSKAGARKPDRPEEKPVTPPPDASKPVAQPLVPEQPMTKPALTAEEQLQREARIKQIMAEMPADMPEATKRAIAENDLELEKALKVKKGTPMEVEKADKQAANPKYRERFIVDPEGEYRDRDGIRYSLNPDYSGAYKKYTVNCATCTPAYHLRERGFNVWAKGKVKGSGSLNDKASRNWFGMWKNVDGTPAQPTTISKWMKDKMYLEMNEKRYAAFFEEACKEQGTYAVGVSWKGSGGHATIFKRMADGKLYYIEPQRYQEAKGMLRDIAEICKAAKSSNFHSLDGVLRLDDKLFDVSWADLFGVSK